MASGPLFATFFMTFLFGFGIGFSLCYAWLAKQSPSVTKNDLHVDQVSVAPTVQTPKPEPKPVDRESLASLGPGRHIFLTVTGTDLSPADEALLSDIKPGGVVLLDDNLSTPEQAKALVNALKTAEGLGDSRGSLPFIATYPERLASAKLSLPDSATPAKLGATGDVAQAGTAGEALAKSLAAFGVEVVFGPVLAPAVSGTPEEQARESFSADPAMTTALGLAFADGLMKGGVIPVAKFYPGFGTSGDLKKAPAMPGDVSSLAQVMLPFTESIQAGVPGLMVGHAAVPALDTRYPARPAALSPVLVRGVLRAGSRQYEGVIVAHDLTDTVVSGRFSLEEATVQALSAGCDAVVIPHASSERILAVCAAITQAVHEGLLLRDRLDDSKRRLEGWQEWLRNPKPLAGPLPDLTPVRVAATPPNEDATPQPESTGVPESAQPPDSPATASDTTQASAPEQEPPVNGEASPENAIEVAETPPAEAPEETPSSTPETGSATEKASIETEEPRRTASVEEAQFKGRRVVHEIKEGERLFRIAKQYGVSVNDLMKWNKLPDENIKWGKTLVVYVPEGFTPESPEVSVPSVPPPPPSEKPLESVDAVEPVDVTSPEEQVIAESPKEVASEAVAKASEPNPEPAKTTEPAAASGTTSNLESAFTAPEGTVRIQYEIQRGDMLTKVAAKFGVKQSDIMKWNRLSNPNIKFGRKIDIYVTPEQAAAYASEAPTPPAAAPEAPGEVPQDVPPLPELPALETPVAQTPKASPPPPAPVATSIERGQDADYYVVVEGDTASRLARRFGTSVKVLLDMNGLDDPNHIRIGQRLKVPKQP